ncbi:MAG: cyclic nucleotide-binding domain-containing protein [Enterobacterales bacterium]|nr:cyclic nucleotide-binding domain-containing protein [Enterobacterales bacterium]
MKAIKISSLNEVEVSTLIEGIPYFKELKLSDYEQYQLLLGHSKMLSLEPGEVLLNKDDHGKEIYFLARGRLDVFSEVTPGAKALGQLATGEIIAGLSIINDQPRTATLAASTSYAVGKTIIIATDFRIFGKLHDFSNIKLQTKINFLRLVINNIRFKLAKYQKQYPEHRLATKRHHVGSFCGEVDTVDELVSLSGQAFVLSHLLYSWNKEIESSFDVTIREVKVSTKDKILGFLSKKRA